MSSREIQQLYKLIRELTKEVVNLNAQVTFMKATQEDHEAKMEPVYKWFSHISWLRKTGLYFLTFAGAAAGAWIAISQLLHK